MNGNDSNGAGTELASTRRVTPITEPIDRDNVGAIQIRDAAGGISFNNMIELMDFAKLMAVSQTAVPKHLRGNPGACLAVCMQAVEWRMSPFAVANKSYSVNDRLAYEAGMYHAVACRRAPIKGRVKMEYDGQGDNRTCRVWATLGDGTGDVQYTSPPTGRISPKNSPLWKNDPDQQLFYFSVRAWVRRHFPDVMAGIYTMDELEDAGAIAPSDRPRRGALAERLDETLPDTQLPDDEIAAKVNEPPSQPQPVPPIEESQVEGVDAEPPPADDTADTVNVNGIPYFTVLPRPAGETAQWINDVVGAVYPRDKYSSAQMARKKFHSLDVASWDKLDPQRRQEKYSKLLDGTVWN